MPLTARVLVGRGIVRADAVSKFLEPRLSDLRRPDGMADLPRAVDRLVAALGAGETIGVFGDYDVDGVTTAATLASALRAFGGKVIARAASRNAGYGLGVADVARFAADGCTVLVTGDCGTSDHEALASGRAQGLDVIVIDHHELPTGETRPTRSSIRAAPTTPFPSRGSPRAGSPSTWRRRCAPPRRRLRSARAARSGGAGNDRRSGAPHRREPDPRRRRAEGPFGAETPRPRGPGREGRAHRGTDHGPPGGLPADAEAQRRGAAR